MNLSVGELLADGDEGADGLLTNDGLVRLGQLLEQVEVEGLVGVKFPDLTEFLSNSEKYLIILLVSEGYFCI